MYNFFLDGTQLPIAPEELITKINNKNKTITLINEGEVSLLKQAGLTSFEFTVDLPNQKYPFAVYPNGYQPASYYLEKLERLKVSKKPFRFIVNRMRPNGKLIFDTNINVSLEDYIITESVKTGFDLEVTIKLKQYKAWGTKTVKIENTTTAVKTATVQAARDTSSKTTPKTHTVVRGDTLWAIAKRHLGNGARYPELAKLNNITNPNLIYIGQVIRLE
ncbi:LysM domain-containing protein [Peptococcaceae bacterium 1198_IL3148]